LREERSRRVPGQESMFTLSNWMTLTNLATSPATRALRGRVFLLLAIVALLCAAQSRVAVAALGADVESIELDRVHMKSAAVTASQSSQFTVHEMLTARGTTVRQYASPAGIVFAVGWKGPFLPDLRQLLGTYFDTYVSAPRTKRFGHSRAAVERADLVVHSSGHARAYTGFAYVPTLVPPGVAADQLERQAAK
jgi:Protein of unknown function (DUF2844)